LVEIAKRQKCTKNAMPISFDQNCLHLTFHYTQTVNLRNGQVKSTMHVKLLQKNFFVENVWPANLAVFIYVSTHYVDLLNSL